MNTQITDQFTKEAIKARMMQNAANMWDVKNPQSLDPFIKLLVEAFSIEIYKASNEAQSIEARMLDKIARMLTPNLLTMPQAAHGIMQVMPAEPSHELSATTHLYVTKKIGNREMGVTEENVAVNFTPVDAVKLTKARVAYLASGYQLYAFDETNASKIPLLRAADPMSWGTCYVGIEVDKQVSNLQDTTMYFEFRSFNSQPWVYQLLPLINIVLDGNSVPITPGLQYAVPDEPASPEELIFQSHDVVRQLTTDIKNIYNSQFLTLGDCPVLTGNSGAPGYPAELEQNFGKESLITKAAKNVVWMQVKFPASYAYNILDDLVIGFNAFPVVNRTLLSKNYSYKALNNILPLRTSDQEHFLAVNTVADGHNRFFSEIPFKRSARYGQGYYSVRHGGAERFDERSAQDMVKYLLELTRDEVAAFSSLNQDYIIDTLKDLSRQLGRLQDKAEKIEANVKQAPTYLVIEPFTGDNTLSVTYWVTQSSLGNNLRVGTVFEPKGNADIIPNSAILLTDTNGGREKLQSGESLDAYRYVLGSRGRLITNEDIRNFCKYELSGKLKDVVFKKGLAPSSHPKQSYIRTQDVILKPFRYEDFDEAGWDYLARMLHAKIIANSPDAINYRVFVDKN